jgi:hypothetical protein
VTVGGDVVPTGLETGAPCGGWIGLWYEQKGEWAAQMQKCHGDAEPCYFGKGHETGFPVVCSSAESRKSGCAESKPHRQVKGGYISSVIYQEYVIRLIIVSGFLFNYMPMIYQPARMWCITCQGWSMGTS